MANTKNVKQDNILLHEIIDNSFDSIFVTDRDGNILIANPAAAKHLNLTVEEMIGANVKDLIKRGYYDRSTAWEAAERKQIITGIVRSINGMNLMATSTPLLDENGEVTMVITNSRNKDAMEEFIAELEKERSKVRRYEHEVNYLRHQHNDQGIVAESRTMREILIKASTIAKADSTVMIYGESGTGKEVIAKYIHRRSLREKGPFIAINCAAIPETLIESELFGYEKGAFTGASNKGKPGIFEIADGGTILLDEIAEMPIFLQPKLLRVLETSEIRRVGDTATKKIDVRVIGATNKNLKQMVKENLFRDDLFYRLNVIPIEIPPLRERPADVLALADSFLKDFNAKFGTKKYFEPGMLNEFVQYSWPGNVRELRNVVERLVITSTGNGINPNDSMPLAPSFAEERRQKDMDLPSQWPISYKGTLKEVLHQVEEQYIKQVLEECNHNIGEAANRLGIHRSGLYRKINNK